MLSTEDRWREARSLFVGHEIVSRGDRWWCCKHPKTGFFGFDVYADNWGGLAVGGFFEGIRFACRIAAPAERVHWIGRCDRSKEVGISQYEIKKAMHGSGYDRVLEFSLGAAVEDLRMVADEQDFDDVDVSKLRALAEEAEADSEMTQDDLMSSLMKIESDAWDWPVGMRPTDRVILAHAAVTRLSELLREESP